MLPTHVRHRITSWRWAREAHPFPEDTASSLWQLMRDALKVCPGYNPTQRTAMLAWASGALYLPDAMAATVMSTSRANPVWETVTRWTRRLGA
jgi:hypothetical protein